jgi:UDP-GlcNAc:undecaprenyl-phosphate GlcNAc-1-phosphate transferase
MFIILTVGILDDFHPLLPRVKFLFQLLAAFLVVVSGYSFHRFFFFDPPSLAQVAWLWNFITVFWIVGLCNAVNLLDGIDGLCGGFSTLVIITYIVIFTLFPDAGSSTFLCAALAASVMGFLVYNLPLPHAKIFMGDGGSQFMGFMLAVLPLLHNTAGFRTGLPLFYAALIMALPIFDTTAAVWRRVREGRPINSPDRFHTHHKLLDMQLSVMTADAVLYALEVVLGLITVIAVGYANNKKAGLAILFSGYVIALIFFSTLHFRHKHYMEAHHKRAA